MLIDTSTIYSFLPLATTGSICQKSPPRTTVFPPKDFSPLCGSLKRKISLSERSKASKQFR
jgi:hypothetical protein